MECAPGHEKEIITTLKRMPEVVEINGVWGKYDIFLKVSSPSMRGIEKMLEKIRLVKEIVSSDTIHVIYGQGGSIDDIF